MHRTVLVTPRSLSENRGYLEEAAERYGFTFLVNDLGRVFSEEEMISRITAAEALIVGLDPVTERVLAAATKLKVISKYGAGLDNIDLDAARSRGVQVLSAAGANAQSVAELAIGLMFSLARGIGGARTIGAELRGKTLGILGLGNIGRRVAEMGEGLGMRVLSHDPFPPEGVVNTPMDDVIESADFLSLHLPLTDETREIIDPMRMKKGSYLINTARGGLVDEAALAHALRSGWLAGAASDVSELAGMENVIVTPHIGAYTREATLRTAQAAVENVVRALLPDAQP